MKKDEEGFFYPFITDKDKCKKCNQCIQVCSFIKWKPSNKTPKCFAGWLKDEKTRLLSTSGGAFSAIADAAYREGYVFFYGAAYNKLGNVNHIGVPYECIADLRGTKYVQSTLDNCFIEIKKQIKNGKKVMFVGTPCQVAGIHSFVGNKYRSLILTISLVCHGVASPDAFKRYCLEMESTQHGKIVKVIFRDKAQDHLKDILSYTTLLYEDGYRDSSVLNPYTTAFGLGLMHRPSCSSCPFTTVYRNSDLTIGDFWGLNQFQPDLSSEFRNGISLILAHTQKGEYIVSKFQNFQFEEKKLEWATNNSQPQLSHPHKKNPHRDQFLQTVLNNYNSFVKTANREILFWRIKNKFKKVFGRKVLLRLNCKKQRRFLGL